MAPKWASLAEKPGGGVKKIAFFLVVFLFLVIFCLASR
jgi:hypothetical protein